MQEQYLVLISDGRLGEALKLSSQEMKQSADTVELGIKRFTELNDAKAAKAGEDATLIYEQAKLIVGGLVWVSTIAAIGLAMMYARSVTSPVRQSLAIA